MPRKKICIICSNIAYDFIVHSDFIPSRINKKCTKFTPIPITPRNRIQLQSRNKLARLK